MKTNKDIEELLKRGSKLIFLNEFKNGKYEWKFFIDKETPENKITQQQFDEYVILCDNSDLSEKLPNWKIEKTYRCFYWLNII